MIMRLSRRMCGRPRWSTVVTVGVLLIFVGTIYLVVSSRQHEKEQTDHKNSLHNGRKANRLYGNVESLELGDTMSNKELDELIMANNLDLKRARQFPKIDDFDIDYVKKRQQLRSHIVDSEKAKMNAAIDAQNALSGKNKERKIVPGNKNDPFIQLREKLMEHDPSFKSRLAKSREAVKKNPKRYMYHNERKLLVEKHAGEAADDVKPNKFSEHKQQTLSRIAGLGSFDIESYLSFQRMVIGEGDPMKRFQFNQVASDATPPDRYLKDYRNQQCNDAPDQYQTNLPAVSVIICFHNEARSALLRTIVSVMNRSPPNLLREIILVDDFSDDPQDGDLLATIPKVKLIRLNTRHGLIKARILGTKEALGPVLLFLDSHCEVTSGWLEPLLGRIKMNSSHLVSPVIDILNKDNMQYTTASPVVKGGFGPNLHFKWDNMSPAQQHTRKSPIEPIRTPAIAGGLFAVDKKWFEHIGMYDDQMEIWGGENVELSLRVWMCGGSMEIIPCSHVGHIFRSAMPYSFGGGTYHSTVTRNIRRTVEVWLDEYKPFYYEKNPFSLKIDFGDISERQDLRRQLHCKSFKWFLDNIYPQFDAPPIQDFTYGQLRSLTGGLCLDSLNGFAGQPVEMKSCKTDNDLRSGQGWVMYSKGGIKHQTLCLAHIHNRITLQQCKGGDTSQAFELLRNGLVFHSSTHQCLSHDGRLLTLVDCDKEHNTDTSLEWDFLLPSFWQEQT